MPCKMVIRVTKKWKRGKLRWKKEKMSSLKWMVKKMKTRMNSYQTMKILKMKKFQRQSQSPRIQLE